MPSQYGSILSNEEDKKSTTNVSSSSSWMLKKGNLAMTMVSVSVIGCLCGIMGSAYFSMDSSNGHGKWNQQRPLVESLLGSSLQETSTSIDTTDTDTDTGTSLSHRGSSLKQVRDDMAFFVQGSQDAYHPIDNPDGYFVMLVAENKLMWKDMAQKLQSIMQGMTDIPTDETITTTTTNKNVSTSPIQTITTTTTATSLPSWIFNYGDMGGEIHFKQAMANMMQTHSTHTAPPIHPNALIFQDGAGSVLSQLSYLLTDPGDTVMTTAPGYMAFEGDFGIYGQTNFHWIDSNVEQRYVPTLTQLEDAYQQIVSSSSSPASTPRVFVICQPHNPTGVVYTKAEMEHMMDWALSKGMHVISDEIYAQSIFPVSDSNDDDDDINKTIMISAADIMYERWLHHLQTQKEGEEEDASVMDEEIKDDFAPYLGDYVHIVAGLSKDWGMSGFRIGSLFSHNTALLQGMDAIGYYQSPSRYTQFMLTQVFQDTSFVQWYIEENQKRLYETYQGLQDALALIDVPMEIPTQGGIFAWADFSKYLLPIKEKMDEEDSSEREHELWMDLFDNAKVALTSGVSCRANKPGVFRIVYGWPVGGTIAMKDLGKRLVQWKMHREQKLQRP